MKAIFCLFLSLLAFLTSVATAGSMKKEHTKESQEVRPISKSNKKALSSTYSRWFDYGDAVHNYNVLTQADSSKIFSYPFFPDSTLKYEFSDGLGATFHCLGNVLQPTDTLFRYSFYNGEYNMLDSSKYFVDSISTEFYYIRNIHNVTDSLIIKVGVNATASQSGFQVFNPNVFFWDNFGDSTVNFRNVPYSQTKNELGTLGNMKRYAFPLNDSILTDTTDYGSTILQFATNSLQQVDSGKLVYFSMSFKPGFTWNVNVDTLNTKNYIRYFYYKERADNHDNTLRYYREDSTGTDYNRTYFVNTKGRYNLAGTFNNRMYPRNVFSKALTQDQLYVQYKLSFDSSSVIDAGVKSYFSYGNISIYPNPTNNILNIRMTASNNTIAKLININGQVVFTENVSNKASASIDMNGFAKGIYTLQIVSEKGVETKKVIKQ